MALRGRHGKRVRQSLSLTHGTSRGLPRFPANMGAPDGPPVLARRRRRVRRGRRGLLVHPRLARRVCRPWWRGARRDATRPCRTGRARDARAPVRVSLPQDAVAEPARVGSHRRARHLGRPPVIPLLRAACNRHSIRPLVRRYGPRVAGARGPRSPRLLGHRVRPGGVDRDRFGSTAGSARGAASAGTFASIVRERLMAGGRGARRVAGRGRRVRARCLAGNGRPPFRAGRSRHAGRPAPLARNGRVGVTVALGRSCRGFPRARDTRVARDCSDEPVPPGCHFQPEHLCRRGLRGPCGGMARAR